MKNNETGEFELVMGNRQLLSGFFIIVILFAVFFVMGYIVGRNSTPATQLAAKSDQNSGAAASSTRPAPAPQNPPAAAAEQPKEDADGNAPATDRPATQAAQPPAAKPEPPAPATSAAPADPTPGEMYLQVTSVKPKDVAETVAKTLKGQGFPTSLFPGPDGKTRVWVGPYTDRGKLGEAKAGLERLGFGPFVVKPAK